jgi:hypothetical protein
MLLELKLCPASSSVTLLTRRVATPCRYLSTKADTSAFFALRIALKQLDFESSRTILRQHQLYTGQSV